MRWILKVGCAEVLVSSVSLALLSGGPRASESRARPKHKVLGLGLRSCVCLVRGSTVKIAFEKLKPCRPPQLHLESGLCHERFGESVEEQIFMQQLDCILDMSPLGSPHSLKESSDSFHRVIEVLRP